MKDTIQVLFPSVLMLLVAPVLTDEIASELSRVTGLPVAEESFSNWGGTVTRGRIYSISPLTTEDVQSSVLAARDLGLKVRASGSAHSWSDLYSDSDSVRIDMSKFEPSSTYERMVIGQADYYRQYPTVTASANVNIAELTDFLNAYKLMLTSGPLISNPTVAGLTATGSHGINYGDGSFSEHVVKVKFVTGDGDVMEFDADREADLFNMYRAHLGVCGIITHLTLRTQTTIFAQRIHSGAVPLGKVLRNPSNLRSLLNENVGLMVEWLVMSSATPEELSTLENTGLMPTSWSPVDDNVKLKVYKEWESGFSDDGIAGSDFDFDGSTNTSLRLADGTSIDSVAVYGYLPSLLTLHGDATGAPITVQTELAFGDNSFWLPKTKQAVGVVANVLKTYAQTEGALPLSSLRVAWWRHTEGCYLCHSAAADRDINQKEDYDHAVMLEMECLKENLTEFEHLVTQIFEALTDKGLTVLPHFGKHHSFLPDIQNYLSTTLKPNIDAFLAARAQAKVDEYDLFVNDYMGHLLYPGSWGNVTDPANGAPDTGPNLRLFTMMLAIFTLINVRFIRK